MIGRRSVSTRTGASSDVVAFAIVIVLCFVALPAVGAFALSVVSVVAVKAVDLFRESDP